MLTWILDSRLKNMTPWEEISHRIRIWGREVPNREPRDRKQGQTSSGVFFIRFPG